MKLGAKAARAVASLEADARRRTFSVRLIAIGLFELGALVGIPLVGISREVGSLVLICGSSISLVLLVPVFARGTIRERFLALLLCPFPLLLLGLLLVSVLFGYR